MSTTIAESLIPVDRLLASLKHTESGDDFLHEAIDDARQVFIVPYGGGALLYAPRIGVAALLDEEGERRVRAAFAPGAELPDDAFLKTLRGETALAAPDVAHFRHGADSWKPTTVTFSTTQKCTLRCHYCYAEGGRLDDLNIPWPVAKAAIDFVVRNAMDLGTDPNMNFLGEGEATAAWGEFRKAIEYYRQRCEAGAVTPYIELSTNGVFSHKRVPFLAKNLTQITFSVDGVESVHDANRVLPNGKGSFEIVVANMKAFDALGKRYGIRSTVSAAALSTMPEFVRFVGTELGCRQIHFEPVFDVTRVTRLRGEIHHPDGQAFVEAFREARQVGAEFGIDIYYSGSDPDMRHSFCGAGGARNFLVTARGLVTSCNEVLQPWDPRAQLFQYGRWDQARQVFEISQEKIDKLARLNGLDVPKCQGCFAKFNCAGDCYARSAGLHGDPWSPSYTYRCHITRELLKDNLMLLLLREKLNLDPPAPFSRAVL